MNKKKNISVLLKSERHKFVSGRHIFSVIKIKIGAQISEKIFYKLNTYSQVYYFDCYQCILFEYNGLIKILYMLQWILSTILRFFCSLSTLTSSNERHEYWLEKKGEMIYGEINDHFSFKRKSKSSTKLKSFFIQLHHMGKF